MQTLSVTAAWNETRSFIAREAALLAPIAILFVALPVILLNIIAPDPTVAEVQLTPSLALLAALIGAVTAFGTLAITFMALHGGISVGEALGRSLRRILPLIGGSLLLVLVIALAMIILSILVLSTMGEPTQQSAAMVVLLLVPVLLIFAPRFVLMTAVAANEPGGPVTIIRRSWALTKGHWGRMMGFILLAGVAITILSLAVSLIFGLIVTLLLGRPEPGTISEFILLVVSGLFGALATLYYQVLIARLYVQLAGRATSGI